MAGRLKSNCIGALALTLGACGGGGGASEGLNSTPPTPTTPTVLPDPMPNPVTTPSTENFDTAEYRHSSAAIGSNAIGAWQQGATGKGITIGFVDTGLVPTLSDFAGRIHPSSRDVNGSRPMDDVYGHGTALAGIAAAAHDGKGMEGIAFEATIFMAKADEGCPTSCSFPTDAVVKGIDAARAAGAKVINLSMSGHTSSDIRDAVQRAVNAGIVVVIGAGNSGSGPSDLATQLVSIAPDQVIIVGGLGVSNPDDTINYDVPAKYTTPAGFSQASFLTAPGWLNAGSYFKLEGVVDRFSGTSFAAPVVSGAVALIAQAFPMLTPKQIVLLLYVTADDLGVAGTDSIFGRGRLNIGKAFQPVGTLRMANSMAIVPASIGTLPAAAGDAAWRANLKATVLDDFKRPFDLNLAAGLAVRAKVGPLTRSLVTGQYGAMSAVGPVKVAFTVDGRKSNSAAFERLGLSPQEQHAARLLAATAIARLTDQSSAAFGFGTSASAIREQLAGRSGNGFMLSETASAELGLSPSGSASMAYERRIGAWRLFLMGERGSVPSLERLQPDAPYSLFSWSVERPYSRGRVTLGVTRLTERKTVLGGRMNAMFGRGESQTWFADIGAERGLGGGWLAAGAYRRGWTTFPGGQFTTSALSFDLTKLGVLGNNDALAFRLSQELRVENGSMAIVVPISWDYLSQTATEGRRSLSLAPSGREIFLEAGYMRNLPAGSVSLHFYGRRHPNHVKQSEADVGVAMQTNLKF